LLVAKEGLPGGFGEIWAGARPGDAIGELYG